MNQFVELLVSGLSLGCIYALIALGFVVVFKATGVVNFAHGSLLLLGAYVIGRYHDASASGRAVLAAIAVAAAVVGARRRRAAAPGPRRPTPARSPSSPSASTSCWPPS